MTKTNRIKTDKLALALLAVLCTAIAGCGSHRVATGRDRDVEHAVEAAQGKKPGKAQGNYLWEGMEYAGEPWVSNRSRAFEISEGLGNRHISLWASHGRYYDREKGQWKWQRPALFGTTEDLFTQTIVVPFLIPMLESAGANVFTPRERDWQRNEIIIDNDSHGFPWYWEFNMDSKWKKADKPGFAPHKGVYRDGENPFEAGTARMAKAVRGSGSEISYQPQIDEAGRYAVYVSYPTVEKSVADACYTVYHKGQKTVFSVNQKMGGGTWVYLGTFDFDKGCNESNRVTLSNVSREKGFVTADAVRFGGGMGNIERGGSTSGLPRCLEGARYYAQWAGAPYGVYSTYKGEDDYKDDINVRSLMTNWLAGGSCYAPEKEGKGVPIELSLAVHSDAGYAADFNGLIGSLSICTTGANDGKLNSGAPRSASKRFAEMLLENTRKDIAYKYGKWAAREVYDRNYSETRIPGMPSAILETMSHQNFPDMAMGQDPNFRFTLARSIYKTILRFVAGNHNGRYTVAPLAPRNFSSDFTAPGEITLKWSAEEDAQEPSAKPAAYILYTAIGDSDFDNGTKVTGNACKVRMQPGVVYRFKVTAVNKGGESFPSETLAATCEQGATKSILVVNGFHRLSAPAIRNTATQQGFDFDADAGVSYGATPGWCGRQVSFDKSKAGIETSGGLGFSGNELQGMFIAGNDFNNASTHVEAIMMAGNYNVASCSAEAIENGSVELGRYHCVDMILGLEKYDANALRYYKTFPPAVQQALRDYTGKGGALLVSGSYIGSDMANAADKAFLEEILKLSYGGKAAKGNAAVNGMGTSFEIYRTLNETHYAATSPEVLSPLSPAFCTLTYPDGASACVAYDGKDYRALTMGFPFECITNARKRSAIMRAIIDFLTK